MSQESNPVCPLFLDCLRAKKWFLYFFNGWKIKWWIIFHDVEITGKLHFSVHKSGFIGKQPCPLIWHTVVPRYPQFHFLCFQLPEVNHGLKILNGKLQNKQFISFQLHTVLSSGVKSRCPAWGVNHSFVQHIHAVCTTPLIVTYQASW